jgi:hypothetical protein
MRTLKLTIILVILGPVLQIFLGTLLWDACDTMGHWSCKACGVSVMVGFSPMDKYQLFHQDPEVFPPTLPCHCHAGGHAVRDEIIICGSIGRWPSIGLFVSYWCTMLLPVVVLFLFAQHYWNSKRQTQS